MSNAHGGDVFDFEKLSSSEDISFELYTAVDPESQNRNFRSQYKVPDGGVQIFRRERANSTLSVQRLLWADGWLDKALEPCQEATLVVLKFVFRSTPGDFETKLQNITATLQFRDSDESRAKDPEVIAWAPFHQKERFNPVLVHRQNATKTGGGVDIGYGGAKIAVDHSREGSVSWDQTCFDEGHATQKFNGKERPNGIQWTLQQNYFQNQGLRPEFWAAILVSRVSQDPYKVWFNMTGRENTFDDLKLQAKKAIGLPEDGSTFRVTPKPGEATTCELEGKDIIKCVNLEKLDELVDPATNTELRVNWGPKYQLGAGEATGSKSAESAPSETPGLSAAKREEAPEVAAEHQTVSESEGIVSVGRGEAAVLPKVTNLEAAEATTRHQVVNSVSRGLPISQAKVSALNPSVGVGATARQGVGEYCGNCRLGPESDTPPRTLLTPAAAGADVVRLSFLEARMAQLEARLADQDTTILRLQQAQLAKDVQLFRVEQALAASKQAAS